ncbi:MAG TPA: hypothetical protein VG146_18730 [Verrucomicrobiae bacterium]|nr:hypothetical protein [Verrucomicrobiae bacterium]
MKTKLFIFLFGLWAATWTAQASQTALLRLYNNSLRMYPGKCDCGLGGKFYLYFSSFYTEDIRQADGELLPVAQPAPAPYGSYLILEDVSMSTSTTVIYLDVPSLDDANGDGLNDFLNSSQAVSTTTHGKYPDPWGARGYDDVTAVWFRIAGATSGSCDITLDDRMLGPLGPFHHTFELVEYTGTLSYSPGSSSVAGSVLLGQTGGAAAQMQGEARLVKSDADPFNVLTLQAGSWSADSNASLDFSASILTRNPSRPSWYTGQILANSADYRSWTLTIQDVNDSDHDGIPDLSDALAQPRPPQLSLVCAGANLRLTIRGDIGHDHIIQQADSPNAITWTTLQTLTLASDPQDISIPLPASAPKFWRVLAQ